MKTLGIMLAGLLVSVAPLLAQPNVRAHYAHGQVWVVWDVQDAVVTNCVPTLTPALSNGVPVVVSNCLPATYAIYWSENPVTNTTTATLVGRLFAQEWAASILRDNVNASFGVRPTGFRIPDGAGGYQVLATNEGLFVHTVRSNLAGYYAVRPFGVSNVPAAWRAPLTNAFFDLGDPPTCHLQARGTNEGYPVEWWTMWTDGDTNLAAARPDFPIMENDKRRGIPHNFSVLLPRIGSLPATSIPGCVAFHSGDAQAKMWLPENTPFKSVGLAPAGQLLVAVEDRFFSIKNGVVDAESITAPGYVPRFDPFFDHQVSPELASPPEKLPASDEVVVPYPLYRLNWTLDWLYAHKNVDSNRVALVGHSGGGKGSLLWSHASPERFAYVGLYNPALGGPPFSAGSVRQIGTLAQNLPLLLTNHAGQLVRVADTHEFAASFSPLRDLPFTRLFHGKREENWALDGDQDGLSDLTQAFRQADALALGAASFWDLRRHGMDTWTYATLSNDVAHPNNCGANPPADISASWGIEDLWVPTLATQFRRDDATNQIRHRADRSYPAFFNCELRSGHEDIGSVIYTNNSGPYLDNGPYDGLVTTTECLPPWTGDARGTFGGYFDWEPDIIDTPANWSAVLFLVGPPSAFNPVEACPDAFRLADITIRRPQRFRPATGTMLDWRLENSVSGALITNGTATVGADDLVSVPGLLIPRDPLRARIIIGVPPPQPPCPTPVLSIRQLTNGLIELSWPSCPSNFYQIEWTRAFQNWNWLTPPLAAPPANGTMTWITPVSPPYQFFRLAMWPLTNSTVPAAPGIYARLKLEHGGIVRNYRLNLPTNYTGAAPAPLMLALHGHNQTADEFAGNQPALASYANALGVILVFPDSTASERGTGWNILDPTPENPVDDVGFLLALIDELDATLNIDRKRVYAGGFSNGGQMCHRLGSQTTNVFAALAAVGSAIAGDFGTGTLTYQPPPSQPMPVLIVNATNDCKRPFWGGINEDGNLQPPAFDQVTHWTNANSCAPSPIITTNVVVTNHVRRAFADSCAGPYPPFNDPVTNRVIREHYQLTCTPGTEVLFVTLSDGGHKWPEANDNVGFDASREALEFFLRHCRCDAADATDSLAVPTAPGRYDLRLCDENYSRLFRLQVPAGYVAATATPIVFAMHGGGQTMVEFATQHPALFAKANAENILLVLPEALDHPQTRETLWMNKPFDYVVDDRVFFTNLLEHIAAGLNVDRKRVYACGFSGGGSFSHWFAATWPGVLAAIAPVCTQTGWNEPESSDPIVAPPAPLEPIAVLMVRGTLDSKRPFNGGLNIDGVECRSAADDTAYWTAGNACVGAPVITSVGNLMRWEWAACAGTTEVVLVAVGGMGHLWPDAADGFSYDANVEVIDFLLQHARP